MAFDFIVDHAQRNVWCNPRQDLQARVKPKKIVPTVGVWNQFQAVKATYALPEMSSRFFVYQIGQLNPALMGLLPQEGSWINVADACNAANLIVDIYADSGIQMPRHQCWYMITADKNVLLAVKQIGTIPVDLRAEDIYFRVYTNAFFQSSRSTSADDYVEVMGTTALTTDALLNFQQQYNARKILPGATYAFVNGYMVSGIDLFTAKVGDVMEFVYDSSIQAVIDFQLKDLKSFNSTLDAKQKYLLHYASELDDSIDYQDDIDFFVCNPKPGNRHQGVYYHRNAVDAVRMVTHKDYSVVSQYLEAYIAARSADSWDFNTLFLRMQVRKSGYLRPLVFEANHIQELYKMADADVVSAMLSINATVPVWTADGLESSGYCAVMRNVDSNIPNQLVQSAYGYNALSKLIGDTPAFTRTVGQVLVADVPYGLQTSTVAYEYDTNGLLLGYYQHIQGTVYPCHNQNAVLVEFVAGQLSTQLDEVYGAVDVTIDPAADYRYYVCPITNGVPSNVWMDVTGSSKYTVLGANAHWNVDTTQFYTLVRGNKSVLGYGLDLSNSDGLLEFTLTHMALRGTLGTYVMQIPMGELDVFLNGRSLIEGLDYIVQFPKVVIINKKYLTTNATQHIDVRFTGFCNTDLTRTLSTEVGYVDHGLLSNNNKFDLRDDKVVRIQCGGAVYDRSELLFSENDSGVTVPTALNGEPYQIRRMVVPLRGLVGEDTYSLLATAKATDKLISAYLSAKLPEPTFTTPNVIDSLYPVYSPFFAKVLFDLIAGNIDNTKLSQFYSDTDVYALCKPYEYLLAFDPTTTANLPDPNYVAIHPHQLNTVVSISIVYFKFMSRVVKLYLNNRVNMNGFINLTA